jgi:hypothetical protein
MGLHLQPSNVHGLVWDTDVLDYHWTEEGALVLVIKDRERMLEQLNHLFDTPALATSPQPAAAASAGLPAPGLPAVARRRRPRYRLSCPPRRSPAPCLR